MKFINDIYTPIHNSAIILRIVPRQISKRKKIKFFIYLNEKRENIQSFLQISLDFNFRLRERTTGGDWGEKKGRKIKGATI